MGPLLVGIVQALEGYLVKLPQPRAGAVDPLSCERPPARPEVMQQAKAAVKEWLPLELLHYQALHLVQVGHDLDGGQRVVLLTREVVSYRAETRELGAIAGGE